MGPAQERPHHQGERLDLAHARQGGRLAPGGSHAARARVGGRPHASYPGEEEKKLFFANKSFIKKTLIANWTLFLDLGPSPGLFAHPYPREPHEGSARRGMVRPGECIT